MNRGVVCFVGALGCLVMFGFLEQYLSAQNTNQAEQNIPSEGFGDKYVLISLLRTAGLEKQEDRQMLSDARLVKMGDRYFIRGKNHLYAQVKDDPKYKMLEGADVGYEWQTGR